MVNQSENISYQIDEFLKYKSRNNNLPSNISPYCYNNRDFNSPNIENYVECLKMITETIRNKIDVNDVIIKNEIRHFVNTINSASRRNCSNTLSKFKNLSKNYISKEHVQFLAQELIVCAMRCPVGIKGIHKEKALKSKSISENISDVIKYFCNNITKENNNGVGFHDELLKLCRKFFMDFVNLIKFMDQNNENTSDSYKGFMTLFGLIFENGLIPHKYILDCFDSIKRTIFCYKLDIKSEQITNDLTNKHEKMFGHDKNFNEDLFNKIVYFDTHTLDEDSEGKYICYRSPTECVNFYKGYENFAHHYMSFYNKKVNELKKYLLGYESIHKLLLDNADKDKINECFVDCELEVSEENYENNRKNMIEKYEELIKNLKNHINTHISNLEHFIDSNNDVVKLNDIFRVKNKDQLNVPLKPHIMLTHNEICDGINNILHQMKEILSAETQ